MLVIGLTGGIASGKSTVADALVAHGAALVDTDRIARQVVMPGTPGLAELVAVLGASILAADGSLERRALRARVFADDAARRQLESILHPRIRSEAIAEVARASAPYVVLAVPLLVESGHYEWVDRVLVVDIPAARQLRLLQQRDDIDATLAQAMIAAQASREARLARADDVIRNSGGIDALLAQAAGADRRFRQLAMQRTGVASAKEPT